MNFVFDPKLEGLATKANKILSKYNPQAAESLSRDTIRISSNLDVDAGAIDTPLYVGDSNLIGNVYGKTAALDAAFTRDSSAAGMQYLWNPVTRKYDINWAPAKARGMVGDSSMGMTLDAAGVLVAGQLLSPNGVNQISEVFRQPLAWSDALSLVKVQPGDNPWAEAQSMYTAAYSGWGAVNTSGSPDNTNSQDVEVQAGIMTQPIINIDVTYKLSVQELERAKSSGGNVPYAGQLIAQKQAYASWVMDTIRDGLIYYGNAATGNVGLLNVNTLTAWTSIAGNETLTTILADGANTAKGAKAYRQLATAVSSFLSGLKNKVSKVNIRISPEAYNQLGYMNYSDVYDPTSALQIMMSNFMSGKGKGAAPIVEILPDPMLSASGDNNFFNSINNDYLVMTADEIPTGPDETSQSLIWYGQPLGDFTYPVVPQQFSTQYRSLRRVSGIFAPLSTAVKVYSTYGK
jgi:hypothetical protein